MSARAEPVVTDRSAFYWTSGADGRLRILRCRGCGHWLHPPKPVCPACRGRDLAPEAVCGRGSVWSWTIGRIGPTAPDLVAEIELAEQPGLRVTATVVGTDEVVIGMPVRVAFEPVGRYHVPVFVP
jgi:uncharacterized OB-fold protein